MPSKSKLFLSVIFLLGFALGLSAHFLGFFKNKQENLFHAKRLYESGGHLTNPLMQMEGPAATNGDLIQLKQDIQSHVQEYLKQGYASEVSVYVRDINRISWIGIDEDKRYVAASLSKVPLLFSILMMAESDPEILYHDIKYDETIPSNEQNIIPARTLQAGVTYTVDELLSQLIVYSDNAAQDMLMRNINIDQSFSQALADMRLPKMPDDGEYEISAKEYAQFFRLLYNCTYLSNELSEKALKLLSETDFKDGIVAGVPKNIIVAHKFAERRRMVAGLQEFQLHDCGIVYLPEHPYLICVMTKGQNLDTLKNLIRNISEISYRKMSKF